MSASTKQGALDALERRLLEAARLERPDVRARHRAFLALAGGAVLGSATATSTAATIGGASSASGTGTIAAASGSAVATPSAAVGAAGATAVGGAKLFAGAAALAGVAKALALGAISGAVVLGAAHQMHRSEPELSAPAASR